MFEPLAAELAAVNADRDLVARTLRPHLEHFEDGGARDTYQAHSNSLHFSVIELADNQVLGLVIGAIGDIIRTHVIPTIDPFEVRDLIDDDHAAVAEAVIAGDPARARQAMLTHIEQLDPIYRAHWDGDLDEIIEWK
jgi:GntR family transcriptional repressor for pyruvate dehydrogenase complex